MHVVFPPWAVLAIMAGFVILAISKAHGTTELSRMKNVILDLMPSSGRVTFEGLWFEYRQPPPFTITPADWKLDEKPLFTQAFNDLVTEGKLIEYEPYGHCKEYELALDLLLDRALG
jgi:hypothetical protein